MDNNLHIADGWIILSKIFLHSFVGCLPSACQKGFYRYSNNMNTIKW